MSKELVISANRHETRVAVLEDDQVVEVFYQRENEYSLAGSIHKGRVTRVLPGMQSAFVDIGLGRDAFLYVSDFFEDNDEYDKIVTSVEEKVLKLDRTPAPVVQAPPVEAAPEAASAPAADAVAVPVDVAPARAALAAGERHAGPPGIPGEPAARPRWRPRRRSWRRSRRRSWRRPRRRSGRRPARPALASRTRTAQWRRSAADEVCRMPNTIRRGRKANRGIRRRRRPAFPRRLRWRKRRRNRA